MAWDFWVLRDLGIDVVPRDGPTSTMVSGPGLRPCTRTWRPVKQVEVTRRLGTSVSTLQRGTLSAHSPSDITRLSVNRRSRDTASFGFYRLRDLGDHSSSGPVTGHGREQPSLYVSGSVEGPDSPQDTQ